MRLNPLNVRRHRRARALAEQETFRTVRRVAHEELRELESAAPASHEVAAARAALEAATSTEEVVALEPLVRRACSHLGVELAADRQVRIADRWVTWGHVGASYAGVVAASRAAHVGVTSEQRTVRVRHAVWRDQGRDPYGGGGASGG